MYYTILHTWIIMDFNTFIMLHTWIQMDRETLYYALYLDSNGLRYIILYSVHGLEWTAIHYSMLHTCTRMDCDTLYWTRMDCDTLYYTMYMYSNGLRYIILCYVHRLEWTSIHFIMLNTRTPMDSDVLCYTPYMGSYGLRYTISCAIH